jgi:hypothetical protein
MFSMARVRLEHDLASYRSGIPSLDAVAKIFPSCMTGHRHHACGKTSHTFGRICSHAARCRCIWDPQICT